MDVVPNHGKLQPLSIASYHAILQLSSNMKPSFFLTLIAGLASSVVEGSDRVRKQARRPQSYTELKADAHPSLKMDKVNLQKLPQSLVEASVPALSPRQSTANDFYECKQSVCLSFPVAPKPEVDSPSNTSLFVPFPPSPLSPCGPNLTLGRP